MEFQVQKEERLQITLQRIYKRISTMPGPGPLISLPYTPKKGELTNGGSQQNGSRDPENGSGSPGTADHRRREIL